MTQSHSKEYWLYERLKKENSSANPQFSFSATCNWLRAISILCKINSFEKTQLSEFYQSVQRRKVNRIADTLVEDLYFTLHCFLSMASHYCSKRVERGTWLQFCQDIEKNKLVSTPTVSFQI